MKTAFNLRTLDVRMVYYGYFFLLLISCDRAAAYYLARNRAFGLYLLEVRCEKANKEREKCYNKLCG